MNRTISSVAPICALIAASFGCSGTLGQGDSPAGTPFDLPGSGGDPLGDLADEGMNEDELPDWDEEMLAAYTARSGDAQPNAAPGAPNIVVIIADDLPRGLLGMEGNGRIKTPAIDALKRDGVYFENFYLPIGQCGPSRTILWTSLFPTRSGMRTNGELLSDRQTMVLPKKLRQGGYRTGFFGKCHIGTSNPRSLDDDWLFDVIYYTEGESRTQKGKIDLYDSKVYIAKGTDGRWPANTHYTQAITDKAISFMRSSARPFFAWIAHRAPHHHTLKNTGANNAWSNAPPGPPRYRVGQMPPALIGNKANDSLQGKPPQQRASPARYFYRNIAAAPGFAEYLRRAHEQTDYLDRQVERLIEALRDSGKLDDTLIVFVSDNGVFFGERKMCGKGPFNYDEITRVPLVLRWPRKLPTGVTRRALIQSTDLAPTLLAAGGVAKMQGTNGQSFWEVATGGSGPDEHRRSVFFSYRSQKNVVSQLRGVLKDGFKLTHHATTRYFADIGGSQVKLAPMVLYGPETFEMYNLNADSDELRNLLPYQQGGTSALWTALRNPKRRERINDLLRTKAEYQSEAADPLGLQLAGLVVRRTGATTARISWRSVKGGGAVGASTEVLYREGSCKSCTVFEIDDKRAVQQHEVELSGLRAAKGYEARLFSISGTSNGGSVRVWIPSTPRAGKRVSDEIGLSCRRDAYRATVVKLRTDPAPPPQGRCLITTAKGYVLADYQAEYKVCIDDCRVRLSNTNRRCSWEGSIFHPAP